MLSASPTMGSNKLEDLFDPIEKRLSNWSQLEGVNHSECGLSLAARKPDQSYPHLNAIYVIAVITILGNIGMFRLICSTKKSRNQRGNTFMMAIGVCDVLLMFYFCSANIFFSRLIHRNIVVCKIVNILTSYLWVLPWSIFLTVMLDRVFAVAKPIAYKQMMTKKMFSPRSVVLSCFIISLVPTMPLWFDNTSQRNKEEFNCEWCYVPHKNKFWVAWQTVVSFVIPALTIIACWAILIYLFLTRQFQSILKSVTLKAMFVTGFFLLCASPFCISFFVLGFYPPKDNTLQRMTMPLLLMNSMIQPFLYVYINNQLREQLIRLIWRKQETTEADTLTTTDDV